MLIFADYNDQNSTYVISCEEIIRILCSLNSLKTGADDLVSAFLMFYVEIFF